MLDDKYDLMRHPNIRETEDGGAPPYDYTAARLAQGDLAGSPENYELLDMDDFLPEPPMPGVYHSSIQRDGSQTTGGNT
ncbi:MAG: hypothetical protein NC311_13790 [Muribaculaceae bacterium]|nr:hypothetical protein [Muribaculaceae bacterium]